MTMFITGVFLGTLASFAAIYFFVLRPAREEPAEWLDDYGHMERELQAMHQQAPTPAPRAITRLTHRERTIEL